jgi:prepilin peptidase dependent protein A
MSIFSNPSPRERGDVMLEALVGVLVAGLLGAGFAHLASGVLKTQYDAKVENVVVQNLRGQLQNRGVALCPAPGSVGNTTVTMPVGPAVAASVACPVAASVTVSVNGASHVVTTVPSRIVMTIAAADLGTSNNQQPLQMATGSNQ